MRQGDDGGHQRQSLLRGSHVVHERAVDLQRVHRQFGQVAERREAGAEVVDGDAYAHGADCLKAGDTVLDVLHDQAFGDLQLQSSRRMRVNADGPLDLSDEVSPLVLVFLSAASAFLNKVSALAPSSGNSATPILACIRNSTSFSWNGCCGRASIVFSRSRVTSPSCFTSGSTTAKWSAPTRANRLASPTLRVSHSATCLKSASPAGRPGCVVDVLEPLKMDKEQGSLVPAADSAANVGGEPLEKQAAIGESG